MAKNTDSIINALLTIVVSLALLPVVRDFVADAIVGAGTGETILLGLVTIFWVLGTIKLVVSMTK